MVDNYLIKAGNDQNEREQITGYLRNLQKLIDDLEEYLGSVPSGGVVVGYKFSVLLAGDPTNGYLRTNNADPTLVLELGISQINLNGNDVQFLLDHLAAGDTLGIFQTPAPHGTCYYTVTGTPTDNGGWISVPVTYLGGTALLPADQDLCDLYIVGDPKRQLPPGGDTGDILDKISATDYDTQWVDGNTKFTHAAHIGSTNEHPLVTQTDPGFMSAADKSLLDNYPHSNLQGVTPDQHHAQIHDHSTHTNIGVDDHHAQIHSHDSHTGIGPDDHHSQTHLLYGPDHTDVNTALGLAVRHGLNWNGSSFSPEFRMNWRGIWGPQAYETHDVVLDYPYTMIANKPTTDRAAPQPIGDVVNPMPEVPLFVDQANASSVWSGHKYTFTKSGEMRGIRVWVPEISGTTSYRLVLIADGVYKTFLASDLAVGQWNLLTADSVLVLPGKEVLIYVDALNSGSNTQVTGGWTRGVNNNTLPPPAESWNRNAQHTVLRIDSDDLNSTDRHTELLWIGPDSVITLAQTSLPDNFLEYRVISVTDNVTFATYDVVLIDQGVNEPDIGLPSTMTAVIPIAQSTKYSEIPNYWTVQPTYVTVEGFLAFDGVDQTPPATNAYGIDIYFQELAASPDWNVVAISGGGGSDSSEGGGTPFPEAPTTGSTYGRDGLAQDWNLVYTQPEADGLFAPFVHNHDDRYYTEVETDALLADKSDITHNHDGVYLPIDYVGDHNLLTNLDSDDHLQYFNTVRGDARYSLLGHDHDGRYSLIDHIHASFHGAGSVGFVPDPLTESGRFLSDDGTWVDVNSIPAGGIQTPYTFSTVTTGAPAVGFMAVNNSNQLLATQVHINDVNGSGNDITPWLSNFHLGDYIGISDQGGSGATVWYTVHGIPVDEGGWWRIPVIYDTGVGGIPNAASVFMEIIDNPANRLPPYGEAGYELVKLSSANFDTGWTPRWQFDYVDFNSTIDEPAWKEGRMFYDEVEDSISYFTSDPDITINVGQELVAKVRNRSGVTITNGSACYVTGAQGNRPTVAMAQADDLDTARVAGIMTHDLPNNSDGFMTIIGVVRGFDTSAWVEGTTLYLSPTVPGGYTDIEPPTIVSIVAIVTVQHGVKGWLYVKPRNLINDHAIDVKYDNAVSGLAGTNVQDAIDELDSTLDAFEALPYRYITANTVMIAGTFYGVDTTSNIVTVSLPANPSLNDACYVSDINQFWETNNCTIFRNGNTIDGLDEDFIGDVDSGQLTFLFDGATWRFNPDAIGTAGLQGEPGQKGNTGDTGASGAQGLQGPQGETGDTGATGLTGEKGDKGDKGDTGPTGPQGDKGDTGDTGPEGPAGTEIHLTPVSMPNLTGEGITADLIAGTTLSFDKVVYIGTGSKLLLTDADGSGISTRPVGICLGSASNGGMVKVLLQGFIRDDATFNFTPGDRLYLSTSAGVLTATPPTGTGDSVVICGIALTADIVYFNPQLNSVVNV